MAIKVEVTSGPKGGNPGGMCDISGGAFNFSGYFKYVYGKRNGRNSSLQPENQPIYEGLTFQLAREFGLDTPRTFVLDNRERDVQFNGWRGNLRHDPSGRDFYFVSQIVPHPKKEKANQNESDALESEKPYLEALMISDIIGKTPNYSFIPFDGTGKLTYLDLGCSFVHAKEGHIHFPHKFGGFGPKQLRNEIKRLRGKTLLTNDGRELDLGPFVEGLEDLRIPVLDSSERRAPIGKLVSEAEISEIKYHVARGITRYLPNLRRAGLLV